MSAIGLADVPGYRVPTRDTITDEDRQTSLFVLIRTPSLGGERSNARVDPSIDMT